MAKSASLQGLVTLADPITTTMPTGPAKVGTSTSKEVTVRMTSPEKQTNTPGEGGACSQLGQEAALRVQGGKMDGQRKDRGLDLKWEGQYKGRDRFVQE